MSSVGKGLPLGSGPEFSAMVANISVMHKITGHFGKY